MSYRAYPDCQYVIDLFHLVKTYKLEEHFSGLESALDEEEWYEFEASCNSAFENNILLEAEDADPVERLKAWLDVLLGEGSWWLIYLGADDDIDGTEILEHHRPYIGIMEDSLFVKRRN